jgi:hypothetical protein
LLEQALAALRARTKHCALHLLDQELLMLDQRMGARQLGARLEELRSERIDLIRDLIRCRRHGATAPQSK